MTITTVVTFSIGSNINAEYHLRSAYDAACAMFGDVRSSPVYRSTASGFIGDDFLNAVIAARTIHNVATIRRWQQAVENSHQRQRGIDKFCSRTLDIDLLTYGELIDERLPHPDIYQYAFVARPLADLLPATRCPGTNLTFAAIAAGCNQPPLTLAAPSLAALEQPDRCDTE